jgi:hypothetical protein
MSDCGNNNIKFWLQDYSYLFCNLKLVPKSSMNYNEQLNCLTRLVLLIFLILFFVGYSQSFIFLTISLGIIIILSIINNNKMIAENFKYPSKYIPGTIEKMVESSEKFYQNSCRNLNKKYAMRPLIASSFYKEQDKKFPIHTNQNYKSINQKLVGPANPKTFQAPLTVAPPMDLSYWKNSDLTVMNAINTRSVQDFYSSGYYTTPDTCKQDFPNEDIDNMNTVEGFRYDAPIRTNNSDASYRDVPSYYEGDLENIYKVSKSGGPDKTDYGYVIDDNVYDPNNLKYDLPVNYNASDDQLSENVKSLNDEVFTSITTPGLYYKTEVIEPIMFNEGISFTQQIPPRQKTVNNDGTLLTAKDPMLYKEVPAPPKPSKFISPYDVYDPRSNGYGTSYRNYEDTLTGQPRFFYDDTDAIRRPNYLNRSTIDHLPESITYGPMLSEDDFYENNKGSRDLAETNFADQTVQFRSELMTRLMRKKNAEQWQQKLAPLTGNKQMTLGGMGLAVYGRGSGGGLRS